MIKAYPGQDVATPVWLDLVEPTAEEIEQVERATSLRVPTESEIREIESTSRLSVEGGAFYVSTPMPEAADDVAHRLTSVGLVLTEKMLLTVRYARLAEFEAAHTLCASRRAKTAEEAFLNLLEMIVDHAADELERAEAECDEISRRAFRSSNARTRPMGGQSTTLRRIGKLAIRVSHVRESLLGLGRIVRYVNSSGHDGAPTVNSKRLKAIRTDIASLTDYEPHLANKVQFLLDATLGFISIEQNEIVKTLTIASVVGVPPVLVAGVYGMNFRYMPELGWAFGYPMAIGLIVVSALLPLLWFKRRGWM